MTRPPTPATGLEDLRRMAEQCHISNTAYPDAVETLCDSVAANPEVITALIDVAEASIAFKRAIDTGAAEETITSEQIAWEEALSRLPGHQTHE